MSCIALRKLPGWLATIEQGKVKNPEVRARVIQYQNECDDVLWQYWNEGIAINPRALYSVNPGDVLTKEEADTLRETIEGMAKKLSADTKVRGRFIMQAWSKLKSHFKVAYREIPRHELTEAISIINRHTVEWEVVDEGPKAGTVNEAVANFVRQLEAPNGTPVEIFQPLYDAINKKMGRGPLDMARIQRFIQDRVIVDSADLARIAAICLSRLEGAAARAEGKPFLRAKANRVDVRADGVRRLQVGCGDVAFGVVVPPQQGEEPISQGDSVRLEYEKGVSPLSGPFTRVSRDWMAA